MPLVMTWRCRPEQRLRTNSSQDNSFANPEETQAGSAHFGGPYKLRYLNGLWRDNCFVDARGPRPRRVPYCSLYSRVVSQREGAGSRGGATCTERRLHASRASKPTPRALRCHGACGGFTRGPTSAVSRTVYKLAAMQLAAEPRFATQPPLAAHAHSAFFFGASAFLPKRSSMTE